MDGLQWKTVLYRMDDLGVPLFSETSIWCKPCLSCGVLPTLHGGLSSLRHLEKVRSLFQRLDHNKTGTLQKQDVSRRDSQQSTAYGLDLPPTQVATNEDLKGFPTKNVTILVVTVTGWGCRSIANYYNEYLKSSPAKRDTESILTPQDAVAGFFVHFRFQ